MSLVDLEEHYAIPTPGVEEIDKDVDLPHAAAEAAANANLDKEFLLAEGVPAVSDEKEEDDHNNDDDTSITPPPPPDNDILPPPVPGMLVPLGDHINEAE